MGRSEAPRSATRLCLQQAAPAHPSRPRRELEQNQQGRTHRYSIVEVALKEPDDESSIDESSISIKAVKPHKNQVVE